MGQFHVNVYSGLDDVELVGVADVDPERCRSVTEKFGVECHSDYRELLELVDVATIAVPTRMHYDVAREALLKNIHLLVEKPISDNYERACKLFDMAKERELVLHVGHVERFNGAVQELHKIAEDPILIQCRRMGPFDPRMSEDGVVLDLMIHDIDIVLNLVKGDVTTINVTGCSVHTEKDDVVTVQLGFSSGCLATLTASRATHNKLRNMSITCKNKYIFLDFADQEIHVHRMAVSEHELRKKELRYKEESVQERIFVHRDNPLKLELQHFIDCINNKADRNVSVDNELKSLKLALKIIERYHASNAGK